MTIIASEKLHKIPTNYPHIFKMDIDDSGLMQEVAIVKEETDGTIYYIKIYGMHPIDKARLKSIVSTRHAELEPLYEIMSRTKLDGNDLNALDFFHFNYVKVKRPRGAGIGAESLDNINLSAIEKARQQAVPVSSGTGEVAKSAPNHLGSPRGGFSSSF